MKKMITACLCAALVCTSGCDKTESSASDETKTNTNETKILVTLGDSISAGYGLENAETQRYSALLTEKLRDANHNDWRDCNYAVSGDDSTDLLKRLHDGKAIRLPAADEIVICIGANNLLGPYFTYLQTVMPLSKSSYNADAAIKQLDDEIDSGLSTLESDLNTMYDFIRERNTPDESKIYLINIYNPYADITDRDFPHANEKISVADYAQRALDRCNAIIANFAKQHNDIILVDIASAFAKYSTLPIQGVSDGDDPMMLDPHPNRDGHECIADTLFSVIMEQES